MIVVCKGHVCQLYQRKDGTWVYRSYQTGRIIKTEKSATTKNKGD